MVTLTDYMPVRFQIACVQPVKSQSLSMLIDGKSFAQTSSSNYFGYMKSIFSPNSHYDAFFTTCCNKFPLPNGLITLNRHICDELYDLFSITLIDIRPEAIVD